MQPKIVVLHNDRHGEIKLEFFSDTVMLIHYTAYKWSASAFRWCFKTIGEVHEEYDYVIYAPVDMNDEINMKFASNLGFTPSDLELNVGDVKTRRLWSWG